MPSKNLRNNVLEFTPTFGTQLRRVWMDGSIMLDLKEIYYIQQNGYT